MENRSAAIWPLLFLQVLAWSNSIRLYHVVHSRYLSTADLVTVAGNLVENAQEVTVLLCLNYLIETGQVLSSIDCETGGRPGYCIE